MGYGLAMLQPTFYEQVSSLTGVRFGSLPALHHRITPTSAFGRKNTGVESSLSSSYQLNGRFPGESRH
jgi:hypothetical protein